MPAADFSLIALHETLDAERKARGMSWSAVADDISARYRDVPGVRPIAASTLTRLATRSVAEGDGVLQMLLWLDRTPESFVPGFRGADAVQFRLAVPGPARILRWDTRALFTALDHHRQSRDLTWRGVAMEIGGATPAMLTRLVDGGRTGLPQVMRAIAWIGQPAASFTRASSW